MARPTLLAFPVLLTWLTHTAAYFSPLGQWAQTSLLLNNTVYVYGGARIGNIGLTNLYTLDVSIPWSISDPAWTDHNGDAGTFTLPQTAFGTMFPAYDNQSFYVWGGGNSLNVKLLEDGFAQYTLASKQWSLPSAIASMPPQRRELNAVISSSGVAYIWGGYGDTNTGYTSPNTTDVAVKIYNDMITFDTVKLAWSIIGVSGAVPLPRIEHSSTMLPNNKMIITGGLTGQQVNDTSVNLQFAPMSDVPLFDTNTAIWTANTATGNVPGTRRMHAAVLASDGVSLIIFGGGTQSDTVGMNDIAVLNTQNMLWSRPAIGGSAPAERFAPNAVIVNGQIIIFFGYSDANTGLNDVGVLDIRQTPYSWTSGFVPVTTTTNSTTPTTNSTSTSTSTSTSSSSGLSAIGGIGGIVGLVLGVLLIVAIIILILCKPWRKRKDSQAPQASQAPSQPYGSQPYGGPPQPAHYNSSMSHTQHTQPFNTYSNVGANQQLGNYAYAGQSGYGNPMPQYGPPGSYQGAYTQHDQQIAGPKSPTSALPAYPINTMVYKPNFDEATPTYMLKEIGTVEGTTGDSNR